MIWKYILKEQPENGRTIVQIRKAHGIEESKYFEIRMAEYSSRYDLKDPFQMEEFLNTCERIGCPKPDYWWMYSEDFPFPCENKD